MTSFSILCKNVVIFPSRTAAIENALRLFSPRLAVVDEHLTRHLPRLWLTSSALEVWNRHALGFLNLIDILLCPYYYPNVLKYNYVNRCCPFCEKFSKSKIISRKSSFVEEHVFERNATSCMFDFSIKFCPD